MRELNVGIDLLVVNPRLPDVLGMLQTLGQAHPNLKIVVIGKASPEFSTAVRPHANLEPPAASDSISRLDWLKKVRKLLKEVAAAAAV
jgi:hypothetical protein